eukprot:2362327-Rhodomonas_salina.1
MLTVAPSNRTPSALSLPPGPAAIGGSSSGSCLDCRGRSMLERGGWSDAGCESEAKKRKGAYAAR